ncbi:hypothetical protein ACVBGC_26755 [Burkholderia stagnalis]
MRNVARLASASDIGSSTEIHRDRQTIIRDVPASCATASLDEIEPAAAVIGANADHEAPVRSARPGAAAAARAAPVAPIRDHRSFDRWRTGRAGCNTEGDEQPIVAPQAVATKHGAARPPRDTPPRRFLKRFTPAGATAGFAEEQKWLTFAAIPVLPSRKNG